MRTANNSSAEESLPIVAVTATSPCPIIGSLAEASAGVVGYVVACKSLCMSEIGRREGCLGFIVYRLFARCKLDVVKLMFCDPLRSIGVTDFVYLYGFDFVQRIRLKERKLRSVDSWTRVLVVQVHAWSDSRRECLEEGVSIGHLSAMSKMDKAIMLRV